MIILFIIMLVLTGFVLMILLRGLRGDSDIENPAQQTRDFYQDQLAEIDRDFAAGLIDAISAESARIELKRRALKAHDNSHDNSRHDRCHDKSHDSSHDKSVMFAKNKRGVFLILLLIPIFAFGLYWQLGAPTVASRPIASRGAELAQHKAILQSATRLQETLKNASDGGALQDWVLLAQIYISLNDYANATETLVVILTRAPDNVWATHSYTIALARGGQGVEAYDFLHAYILRQSDAGEELESFIELLNEIGGELGYPPLTRQ